jgi:hypothetical protein
MTTHDFFLFYFLNDKFINFYSSQLQPSMSENIATSIFLDKNKMGDC